MGKGNNNLWNAVILETNRSPQNDEIDEKRKKFKTNEQKSKVNITLFLVL